MQEIRNAECGCHLKPLRKCGGEYARRNDFTITDFITIWKYYFIYHLLYCNCNPDYNYI